MFKHVVIATDGSSHAGKAVEMGSRLAAEFGAKVTVVTVATGGPLSDEMRRMVESEHLVDIEKHRPNMVGNFNEALATLGRTIDDDAAALSAHQALGRVIVEGAVRRARAAGVEEVDSDVVDGDPADAILDVAERTGADLIAMGSRGLSDLEGLLMGSVSHKVCQRAECTCITVK